MNDHWNEEIFDAETMRYKKIQNLINLLQGTGNPAAIDTIFGDSFPSSFKLGKGIVIDGQTIRIGKKSYNSFEIKRVTINTEGSMAIYDSYGKKLCGSLRLNVSLDNIEMFCVWVRKRNIPVEVVSGKKERFFQYVVLSITVAVLLLWKVMKWCGIL